MTELDALIDLGVGEMFRRLEEDPTDVPSHVLIKLVAEANKALERRKAEADAEGNKGEESVLEQVTKLPPAHAKKLLNKEIARREVEIAGFEAALKDLKETA